MKDFRFYLEYPSLKDKRKGTRKSLGNHLGTCVAVSKSFYIQNGEIYNECGGGIFEKPDSVCTWTACTDGYLRDKCKRISEKQAREIHPNLFKYLEQ